MFSKLFSLSMNFEFSGSNLGFGGIGGGAILIDLTGIFDGTAGAIWGGIGEDVARGFSC